MKETKKTRVSEPPDSPTPSPSRAASATARTPTRPPVPLLRSSARRRWRKGSLQSPKVNLLPEFQIPFLTLVSRLVDAGK